MKTLSVKLSKRLNDLGLLDDIETEYCLSSYKGENDFILLEGYKYGTIDEDGDEYEQYKTLTESEAIEFLPDSLSLYFHLHFGRNRNYKGYYVKYEYDGVYKDACFYGKTLLEPIEKMIEYLLNNGLIN